VKLGDASVAAPFTAKRPSIMPAVDIVRQGRSTLVATTQMHQILALSCLLSSYSLSVLYLDRVKFGDAQMSVTGLLSMVSFFAIAKPTPLRRLAPMRPLPSVFRPALFWSMMGQFALHLAVLHTLVAAAKAANIHCDGASPRADEACGVVAHRPRGTTFSPSTLNTVVFLVCNVQSSAVFLVNYKGKPFMRGLARNTALQYSVGLTLAGTALLATEVVPAANTYLGLVPLGALRKRLLAAVAIDMLGAFAVDRLVLLVLAPELLRAQLEDFHRLRPRRLLRFAFRLFALLVALSGLYFCVYGREGGDA
jgi:cation-transporting ATPase 13A1